MIHLLAVQNLSCLNWGMTGLFIVMKIIWKHLSLVYFFSFCQNPNNFWTSVQHWQQVKALVIKSGPRSHSVHAQIAKEVTHTNSAL